MNNGVNKKEKAITGIMKTLITLVFSGTLFFVWITRYNQYIPTPFYRLGNYLLGVVIFVVYFTFTKLYGGFSIGSASLVDIIYSQVISIIFLMGVCYVLFSLLSYRLLNVIPFIAIALAFSVFAALWSFVTNELYYMVHATKKTIVVFNNYDSYLSLKGVRSMEKRYNVVKTVNSQSITLEELFEEMKDLDAVFLCGVPSDYRNEVVKHCIATGKVAYVKPKISDAILRGGKTIQLLNVPVYRCKRSNASISYTVMKRAFDILVALVGIIVTSPVMAVTAIAIKAYDKGPVIYKQQRLTKNGKVFNVYKFRSMITNAEKDGVARLAQEDDDRITPVGKIIRKVRIDELPQLFNILFGDMAVVGPRPERPEIAKQYEEEMPEFALRLQVKAGLTGYAQVYGKYNTPPYDKVLMDLMYVANQSMLEDIRLILMTLKILLVPSSTQGVDSDQITASRKSETDSTDSE